IADDKNMIAAFIRGDDLHRLTAQHMTGKAEVSKKERGLAKPVNFGLIYGMSPKALRRKAKVEYGADMTEADAQRYSDAFFAAYPRIRRWHNVQKRRCQRRVAEVRTPIGRRILVKPDLWHGARANYQVQGTGGDAIKRTLALLWERRHE